MPRISPQPREGAADNVRASYDHAFGPDRDPIAQPGTSTGTPGSWYTTWGRAPEIMASFTALPASTLDPKLRALATIRTGYVRQSQFVFSQHCKVARVFGVAEDKIAAVPYWTVSDVYEPVERAVLGFTDGMTLEGGRVHDHIFALLRAVMSEEHILALSYHINMYCLHAATCRALKMEYDDVPERIVEIPRPVEPGVQDWRSWQWADKAMMETKA
ncbi:hypothetical protein sos41_06970 [Alphaproteobacteria bacterium SO-S41]|nr:hypothetical protein sos41_06970 [Alphaproteobacteria bacterium SO-S41]